MRTRIFCVAMALSCVSARAGAQQVVLTESEALARFSAESPRARAIRAGIEVARSEVLMAGRPPNPRVAFDREAVAGVTESMAMVSQVLPITGWRGMEKRAANASLDAASSRAGDELRRARADLRLAYGDLVAAQSRELELGRARDRLRDLAAILAKREAAGDASGFDRLRAERERLDLDLDLANARADRGRAQANLAGFFDGAIDPAMLEASDEAPRRADWPPVDALVARAESTSGGLNALLHDVEAARLGEQAALRRRIPEPELTVGTKSSSLAGGLGSVVTIQAGVPIFDRAKPEQSLARARAAYAEARAEVLRTSVRAQISALRAIAIDRRETASRYHAAVDTQVGELERIAQVSYDAGERGILELLDAVRMTSTARLRQASLDLAAHQAEVELEYVSGWEIPQ